MRPPGTHVFFALVFLASTPIFASELAPPEYADAHGFALPGLQSLAPLPLMDSSAGQSVFVDQQGEDNDAAVVQQDGASRASVQQAGSGNRVDILQRGAGHDASIVQEGNRNAFSLTQSGTAQHLDVTQWGDGLSVQAAQQ